MNKKLILLIGLCFLAIVLSNFLYMMMPVFKRPVSDVSPEYWLLVFDVIAFAIVVVVLPWTGLVPMILYWLRRLPLLKLGRSRFILLHFSVCFLFSWAQIVIHMLFEPDQGSYYGDVPYRMVLGVIDYFGKNVVFYICVVAAAQAFSYFRQLRQKELHEARLAETLANARLNSLKMKLQPHFIFNALQSVNVLMLDKKTEAASEMISRLGRLLRHSIDMDDTQMVTVENELETVQNYIAIEEIRFKDRLKWVKTIDSAVQKAVIPGLILQPLIENAVKHGIAKKMDKGRIWITIVREGNNLKITVKNDGPGLPKNWKLDENSGFGLQATKKRLELIYGRDASFTVQNTADKEVCGEIVVPFSEEILSFRHKREI
jgi:two-component sensor histidine kinase